MSPSSPLARLVRAVSVGVWVTTGSVAAHAIGDGGALSMVALLPVVVAASSITWWAAGRRISLPAALALLAIPQAVVHLLTCYVHGHVMAPSAPMLAAHAASIGITGLAIAYAERLWWSLWETWSARFRLLIVTLPAPVGAVPALAGVPTADPAELRHVVFRRGPPTC